MCGSCIAEQIEALLMRLNGLLSACRSLKRAADLVCNLEVAEVPVDTERKFAAG